MSKDVARWIGWTTSSLAIAGAVAGFTISVTTILATHDPLGLYTHELSLPLIVIIFAFLGPLVVSRDPQHPVGWIMVVTAILSSVVVLVVGFVAYGDRVLGPARAPWLDFVRWLGLWVWVPTNVLPFAFLLLVFPEGHLPSPRWRPVAWASGVGMLAVMIGSALNPVARMDNYRDPLRTNPYGIPGAGPAMDSLLNAGGALLAIGLLGSILALILRFRRSTGLRRQQLKWMAYATLVLVAVTAISALLYFALPQESAVLQLSVLLTSFGLLGIPLAATVAILRYRLYDIDVIINRTLVYGSLTTVVVGVYVFVVGYLGTQFHVPGQQHRAADLVVSLFTTGIVAVIFQPLRGRLQRSVNRLMYGERDDPYGVLSHLGQRLEATLAPEAVLPTIVETVAQALKLSCVAIGLRDPKTGASKIVAVTPPTRSVSQPAAQVGQGTAGESLPLVYQGEVIGELVFSPRGPGESFTASERRLLADIARQAGVAVHAVRLTADLQKSRERLVTAREEERRRLRRELHDGLGPEVASLSLKLGAARNLIPSEPDRAVAMLDSLTAQLQETLAGIRRLAYDLRPPALDELGLVPAVRESAHSQTEGRPNVMVEAPDPLPALPAAVEVAAYRIATEAVTNVVRHAKAENVVVRFDLTDALELTIQDDGAGIPTKARAGVGITSMRERAAELGGRVEVEALPEGGTRVRARLPLMLAEA